MLSPDGKTIRKIVLQDKGRAGGFAAVNYILNISRFQ